MTYPLTVNYQKTIEQLVEAGKYDYANSDVTSKNFPESAKYESKLEAVLFHPNEDLESEEILKRMEKGGLRPATVRELLTFGAKYPDVQREFPVIALGSVVLLNGNRRVACLDGHDSGRYLDLSWFDGRWRRRCRFLAFRKHSELGASAPALHSAIDLSGTLVTLTLAGRTYTAELKATNATTS
jgi:hypothetical protein